MTEDNLISLSEMENLIVPHTAKNNNLFQCYQVVGGRMVSSAEIVSKFDKIGNFIVQSIDQIDNISVVLLKEVLKCLIDKTEDDCSLNDQDDWVLLFNLLYSQYYKYKKDGFVIYRYGKFECEFVYDATLTVEEDIEVKQKLRSLRQHCRRTINHIRSLICEVFSVIELPSLKFTIVSKTEHELYQLTLQLKSCLEQQQHVTTKRRDCMNSLKRAVQSSVKLESLVSLCAFIYRVSA